MSSITVRGRNRPGHNVSKKKMDEKKRNEKKKDEKKRNKKKLSGTLEPWKIRLGWTQKLNFIQL